MGNEGWEKTSINLFFYKLTGYKGMSFQLISIKNNKIPRTSWFYKETGKNEKN
jgi:hypothetical protein